MKNCEGRDNKGNHTKRKTKLVERGICLLALLCFVSTLSIASIYAQEPSNNKIAVVFYQLHVYESHSAIGCANWDVFGSVEHEFSHREIVQVVLQGCLHEDNTYQIDPTTAIVEELPDNEPLLLWVWVLNDNWWIADDLLSYFNLDISNPSQSRTPITMQTADYSISFDLYDCRSFPPSQHTSNQAFTRSEKTGNQPSAFFPLIPNVAFAQGDESGDPKFICNYPPGQYYRYEGKQVDWTRGYPPDPDLEGCWWIFC